MDAGVGADFQEGGVGTVKHSGGKVISKGHKEVVMLGLPNGIRGIDVAAYEVKAAGTVSIDGNICCVRDLA